MLKSRFPQIAADLQPAIREALKAAAELIADDARNRVPVDTGRLKRAIHVQSEPAGAYVIAGNHEAWYGHIVEHGGKNAPAHPFLIPALEEHRGDAEKLVVEAIHRIT